MILKPPSNGRLENPYHDPINSAYRLVHDVMNSFPYFSSETNHDANNQSDRPRGIITGIDGLQNKANSKVTTNEKIEGSSNRKVTKIMPKFIRKICCGYKIHNRWFHQIVRQGS